MKTIGIDMRLYSQTGVGVYLRNLLHELLSIIPDYVRLYIYVLPEDAATIAKHPRLDIRIAPYKWHTVQEQSLFLRLLSKDRPDLMHFTYFGYPVMYRRKYITTVHDITPLLFRTGKASTKNPVVYWLKHKTFKLVLKNQIMNATAIITPTQTVKSQLVEQFGAKVEGKTTAIYEGVNYELREAKEDVRLYDRYTRSFLLYVGNFYPHKNIDRLIKAYTMMETDIPLLLVGPDDYFAKRLEASFRRYDKPLNIHFHHHPDFSELSFFYKHALALVHPTLSEGFGLPLIEAAYFQTPVIASNIPVIHELLGTSYTAFNPHDTEDIAAKINGFIKNPVKPDYGKLLPRYSFAKMARDTMDLYLRNL